MADASHTVVVLNPVSGGGESGTEVRERARDRGFRVLETEAEGDAVALARRAVREGADRVVAAGGDGTVNEVVQGLSDADALSALSLGVVPAGTGNNLAGNLGVTGIDQAFELLDDPSIRRIDLGTTGEGRNGRDAGDDGGECRNAAGETRDDREGPDERVFVNSCVAGLTAEASEETDSELKRRWGVFAYAVTTLRTIQEFDPLPLSVEASTADGTEQRWSGEAALVLVGNARRFQVGGRSQANVEDGLLEVLLVEQRLPSNLLSDAAFGELLGSEAEGLRWLRASSLDVSVRDGEPISFSLDGEIERRAELSFGVRPGALAVHVGPTYEPDPDSEDVSAVDVEGGEG